jgi:peroxiredoxin
VVLDSLGPERWEPYSAPELKAKDPEGNTVTLADYHGRNVVLVFYLGEECPHCVEQLIAIKKRHLDFEEADITVLAVSSDTPEQNQQSLKMGELPYTLLSDANYTNAGRFKSYDDFKELELHSNRIIDREGKVRWSRIGGHLIRWSASAAPNRTATGLAPIRTTHL